MYVCAFFATLVLSQPNFISSTPTATYSTKTIVTQLQTSLVSNPIRLKYLQNLTDATIVNVISTAPTAPLPDESYSYKIPATLITLQLWPGFHMDPSVLKDTIHLAKAFTNSSVEHGCKGPLPRGCDPFESNGGYGAVVSLTSVTPVRRITWEDLNDVMQGLWDFFVRLQHSFEVSYQVWYGTQDALLIGRGMVEAAGVSVMAESLTQKPKRWIRDECLEDECFDE